MIEILNNIVHQIDFIVINKFQILAKTQTLVCNVVGYCLYIPLIYWHNSGIQNIHQCIVIKDLRNLHLLRSLITVQ